MSQRLAIVMAAGQGTRMKSDLPKVLVPVCGRPMIDFVLDALRRAGVDRIVIVVGHKSHLVREHLEGQDDLTFVEQTEQLGTGHAVMMCREQLASHDGAALVVAGDSPMMQTDSIATLFEHFDQQQPACILGTGYHEDPTGLGRIVRDQNGNLQEIVEEKDATEEQRKITEVNLSCYVFNAADLLWSLERLENSNAQREYYLTDCPRILMDSGKQVRAADVLKPCESLSVNTVEDLARVEAAMREMQPSLTSQAVARDSE